MHASRVRTKFARVTILLVLKPLLRTNYVDQTQDALAVHV